MIELQGVSKRYGGREALEDISFTLPRGTLTFLTGHSGAGKSTLLRLLLRLDLPTRGQVAVGGMDLARMKPGDVPRYRQQIGAVFQDPQLLQDRSVFDNVALPLLIAGYREEDRARRVRAALSRVDLLDKESRTPEQLSTGERQRVGIARAVVNRPAVLLANEPTGNLDPRLSQEIMGLFRLFQQVGVTVLIATHDLELVERFGERVLELASGRLVGDVPAQVGSAVEVDDADA
ncbi:MAG: cell division ATP-binding protein FtsE [Pseudomonadales bacterium]|jgi:cell division transport system ATP-binding protein|nr:cell division ATP-binding protein FtsE [Pseudomonadales bacterium]